MGRAAPLYEIIFEPVHLGDNQLSVGKLCDIAGVSRSDFTHGGGVRAGPFKTGGRR